MYDHDHEGLYKRGLFTINDGLRWLVVVDKVFQHLATMNQSRHKATNNFGTWHCATMVKAPAEQRRRTMNWRALICVFSVFCNLAPHISYPMCRYLCAFILLYITAIACPPYISYIIGMCKGNYTLAYIDPICWNTDIYIDLLFVWVHISRLISLQLISGSRDASW